MLSLEHVPVSIQLKARCQYDKGEHVTCYSIQQRDCCHTRPKLEILTWDHMGLHSFSVQLLPNELTVHKII